MNSILTCVKMFLTAKLVFTIFMLATEKHEGTFIAPVGIGLSLFVAELMGIFLHLRQHQSSSFVRASSCHRLFLVKSLDLLGWAYTRSFVSECVLLTHQSSQIRVGKC